MREGKVILCTFSTEDDYLRLLSGQLSEELDKKRYAHTLGVAYKPVVR